ncbi:MAG TPA: DUF72 domain-containing protein [Candidatus Nitrosocosmicus sp.]
MADLKEFHDKISPLKSANKLGAIIIQLPSSFTVKEFSKVEEFLNALTYDNESNGQNSSNNNNNNNNNRYAIEFRNKSWDTEGTFELLKHYNIASVLTDSPVQENLGFLSDENIRTSNSLAVIRLH